jgi:hypothetical protein
MSYLLLALSKRDVFNSTALPSFDLPLLFLFIKTSYSVCNKRSLRKLQTVVQTATDGFRV